MFQLEKSSTFGSIETTDFDKRRYAYQSLEFNLKDKQFCDLFPDTVAIIQVLFQSLVGVLFTI